KSPIRCFNCQRYGHFSKLCPNNARCCKCGKDHNTIDCKETIVKCIHCDKNHKANDKICKKYIEEKAKFIKKNIKRDSPFSNNRFYGLEVHNPIEPEDSEVNSFVFGYPKQKVKSKRNNNKKHKLNNNNESFLNVENRIKTTKNSNNITKNNNIKPKKITKKNVISKNDNKSSEISELVSCIKNLTLVFSKGMLELQNSLNVIMASLNSLSDGENPSLTSNKLLNNAMRSF
ncbi:hypothetical protein MHBO_002214, partial [Bonamia ostreae]